MTQGTKDEQSVTADWSLRQELIEGVCVQEVKNVVKDDGFLTEVFRRDWELDDGVVDQAFQVTLFPGKVSAWHKHRLTTDRLFVNHGQLKVVLYDDRDHSSTNGMVNEFRAGIVRPVLLIVPPDVWHGVQNLGDEPGTILNLPDRAYRYDDPDHWRVPADSPEIPYSFA